MTTNGPAKFVRGALWASPLVIVPAAFLASIPWLKQQDTTIALGIAATVAVLVMSYSYFLTARVTRRLDEVEIAGQRFAQAQGWTIGIFAAGLAMVFPPAMNGLVDLANAIGAGSPDLPVRLGIVMGFMLVVILQTLGMVAASIWWERRLKGRA
jgi:small-conductance mechanosensitive channel